MAPYPESAAAAYTYIVSHQELLLVAAAAFAVLLIVLVSQSYSRTRFQLPPGPPCLPIIGNMHLLLGKLPHQALAELSQRYGPLLSLRFGSRPVVVVSNATLAKEFLTTHDKVFASRPRLEASNRLLYGVENSIGFARYGPRWRQMRKLCTLELLTTRKGQAFQNIRTDEVELMLRDVRHQSQEGTLAVEIKKFLGVLTANYMGRIMLSKRITAASTKRGVSMNDLVHELSVVFSNPLIGDFIPYLGFLDSKTKLQMEDLHRRLNDFLEDVLAERQRERENNPVDHPEDFLDLLLSANNIITEGEGLSTEIIKATLLEMFSGGIDTSSVTVEWAMAELLRSPATLKKLQTELRTSVGPERRVEVSDMPNLPYLKAVIKETFRLHPPLPLILPRESSEACKVSGGKYIVPANTTLLVNVWAIGRDPESWEKPLEFRPERFEERPEIDIRGQNYELLPFGSGRRNCPGMPVGLSMVELALSNLVHSFDWELPSGQTPKTLDMSEKPGVSAARATPLLAIAKPARPLAC